MNQAQRKQLLPAISAMRDALTAIEAQKSIFDSVRDEEQGKYDNMPDNLKSGEKGEKLEEICDALSRLADWDDNGLDEALNDLEGAM